jgi:O-antigen/teichoic acid export membrane protein
LDKSQNSEIVYIDSISRTKIVTLHTSLTFIYKVLAIGLNYLLVPLTINYLNIEQYGIWMTLLSIMSWISFFDIGLGNGLRNKLAEAIAVKDTKLAKTYISTGFAAVTFIGFIFSLVLISILPFVPWIKIFNTNSINNANLLKVVAIVGFLFILNFVLSLGNSLYYAYQEASLPTLRSVLQNFIALILIYFLINYTSSSLLYLGTCYGLSMVFSNLSLMHFFFKRHPEVKPSIKYIDISRIREITSLGVKFFIIQIAVLVIFSTDNMIITQVLGPAEVTPYNVVFKLFSIVTLVHGIILAPLWSAFTDAYAKGDLQWIKNTLKKLNLLMIPIIIAVIILIIFSRDIINVWVGPNIKYSNSLVMLMGVYTAISCWSNIYAYLVNGIGKVDLQMYSAIVAGLINIPLSIYFAKSLAMGSSGVILGTIASLSLFAILGPIQCYYILNRGYKI